MKKISKIIYILLLILFFTMTCVTAQENTTDIITTNDNIEDTTSIENTANTHEIEKTERTTTLKTSDNETTSEDSKTNISNTTISVDDLSARVATTINITARITSDSEEIVNSGKVVFKVNKESIKENNTPIYVNVNNGTAILTYTVPKSWNKTINIEAVYSGGSNFYSSRSNITTVTLITYDTTISIDSYNLKYNENIRLTSTITDEYGQLVSKGKLLYKINGGSIKQNNTPIYVNVKNGTAVLNYKVPESWIKNNITIEAVYGANELYNAARTKINVEKKDLTSSINVNMTNKTTFDIIYIPINVTDKNNELVSDGKVEVYLNNNLIGKTSLINGSRQLYLGKLANNTYNLGLKYTSPNYDTSTTNITFKVKNVKSSVDILLDTPQATQNATTLELRSYVTYTNSSLLKDVKDGYVIYYLNGKKIAKVNVNNSKALYNYTMPELVQTAIIDAEYYSTSNGNASATKTIKITTKSNLTNKNTQIRGNKDPTKTTVELVNGVPNLSLMTNYVWADENATYTLTKSQYQEVTVRDSYTLYLNNYMSQYVAFKTADEPNIYHVLRRQKWNVIEKALNTNLVLSNGGAYPESLTVNISGKEYTYSEVRDIQNTSYTCGPTSLSMCSQTLKTYASEYKCQNAAGTTYSDGSTTSGLKKAAEQFNMSATIYYNTTFDAALKELAKGGCALIFHTWNHYVAILDISNDSKQVLVGNPSGTYNEGSHDIPTKWLTVSYMKTCFNNYDTSGLILKTSYNLTSSQQKEVNNIYQSFGTKYIKSNTNERIPNT